MQAAKEPLFATAAEEDKNNRSRHEIRTIRWTSTTPEGLVCVGAHSVIEITREVTFLRGKHKGKKTVEKVYYVCSREFDRARPEQMLRIIRDYWDIEGGLHQRLDVTAREDSSRVRNRNAILALAMVRRCMIGHFYKWRSKRKNKRQATLMDYYDFMNAFNNQKAFHSIRS